LNVTPSRIFSRAASCSSVTKETTTLRA
jgi:hypothetical protein